MENNYKFEHGRIIKSSKESCKIHQTLKEKMFRNIV